MTSTIPKAIRGLRNTLTAQRTLIILSHMRSNSTLLTHILGSHPDIAGYREMHMNYRSQRDMLRQRYRLRYDAAESRPRYLLDKVLHNKLVLAPHYLRSERMRFLITLRSPERTIQSIVSMASSNGNARFDTVEKAAAYYEERLAGLMMMAQDISPDRALFIPSDAIITDTAETLERLRAWLGLSAPLSPEYRIFEQTGKRIAGDASANIAAGRIRKADANVYDGITVPEDCLAVLQERFDSACDRLAARFGGTAA